MKVQVIMGENYPTPPAFDVVPVGPDTTPSAPVAGSDHLMDYVLNLHIITGPNGMCMCGVDGITCAERLRRVSHEIASCQLGANMAKEWGGVKMGQSYGSEC